MRYSCFIIGRSVRFQDEYTLLFIHNLHVSATTTSVNEYIHIPIHLYIKRKTKKVLFKY